MKQVWKCDYCSDTSTDPMVIKKHETECVFNLTVRHCSTCDNMYYYYESELCKVHYNGWSSQTNGYSSFYEVLEHNKICKDWTNLKIRKKKLNGIIKKIYEKDYKTI